MRYIPEGERIDILRVLKECKGDAVLASRSLGVSVSIIEWVDIVVNKKFNATPSGLGKPELQAYIVAMRSIFSYDGWDNNSEVLIKARSDYEKGLVELTTGRDGVNLILYAIPRANVDKDRRPYLLDIR